MKTAEKRHADREHAELGGSSAHIWSNCTGSVFLKREIPKAKETQAMLDGTIAHEEAEKALSEFLENRLNGSGCSFVASAKNRESVTAYVKLVWINGLEQTITNKAYGLEEAFTIDLHLHMWGSIDFWAIYINDKAQRTGLVIDYKSGVSEVDVKKNAQLAFYALGLRQFARENKKDLDVVRAAIVQPKSLSGNIYKETSFTAKQLDAWEKKFYKAAHQIYKKQKPTFKVGEWCRWCPAQGACPKYIKSIEAKTELMLVDPEKTVLPEVEMIPERTRINIIRHKDDIKKWLTKITLYEMNLQLLGKGSKELKAVEGRSNRRWISDTDKIVAVLTKHNIDPWDKKLKAFGPIERELGEGALDKLLEKPRGKPILVDAADKRPAIENGLDLLGSLDEEDDE